MSYFTRLVTACGVLVAAALPVSAQNLPPTDSTGRTAPPGADVAPPRSATQDGGTRPPTDATGQTAPAGSPVAPSRLADPGSATPSPPATTR